MVAPRLVPILQALLSAGLFLDAMASGAITPLLPFFVAAFNGSEQTIANLLAVGYGATLAAMVPSTCLLLYAGHVLMLTLGLLALLVSCALLGLNYATWQLYLAMVLTGVSSEFAFAAALAMVAKLHAAPKKGAEEAGESGVRDGGGAIAEESKAVSHQFALRGRRGTSFVHRGGWVGSGEAGGVRLIRSVSDNGKSPKKRASRQSVELDSIETGTRSELRPATKRTVVRLDRRRTAPAESVPRGSILPAVGNFPFTLALVGPHTSVLPLGVPSTLQLTEPSTLQLRPPKSENSSETKACKPESALATKPDSKERDNGKSEDNGVGMVQGVGLLFAAQSMGYVFGPFLVPILYGLVDAWLPFLIIGLATAVILVLLLLLDSERVQTFVGGWFRKGGNEQGKGEKKSACSCKHRDLGGKNPGKCGGEENPVEEEREEGEVEENVGDSGQSEGGQKEEAEDAKPRTFVGGTEKIVGNAELIVGSSESIVGRFEKIVGSTEAGLTTRAHSAKALGGLSGSGLGSQLEREARVRIPSEDSQLGRREGGRIRRGVMLFERVAGKEAVSDDRVETLGDSQFETAVGCEDETVLDNSRVGNEVMDRETGSRVEDNGEAETTAVGASEVSNPCIARLEPSETTRLVGEGRASTEIARSEGAGPSPCLVPQLIEPVKQTPSPNGKTSPVLSNLEEAAADFDEQGASSSTEVVATNAAEAYGKEVLEEAGEVSKAPRGFQEACSNPSYRQFRQSVKESAQEQAGSFDVLSSKENGLLELEPTEIDFRQLVSPPVLDELQSNSPERKAKERNITQLTTKEPPPKEVKNKETGPSVLTAVKGLLLSPYALPAILIVFVEAITMGAVDTLVPLFLMDTCHKSAAESGLIFGALALTYAAAAYWGTSWAMAKVGDIHTMVLGTVAMGLVLPVMALRPLCSLWAQMLVMLPIGENTPETRFLPLTVLSP
jgi:hypothetical protein